jgi:anti-anti-sigma factor
MVVDLSGVEAIDSAGLGELVLLHMWAEAGGYSMKFACPRTPVRQLLELTNLASVFEAYGSVAEAMAAMAHERVCSA